LYTGKMEKEERAIQRKQETRGYLKLSAQLEKEE
jgi:hypothetical protein